MFNIKKKKIIVGSIILGVVIIATGAVYALTRLESEALKLKKEKMTIEYGQTISTDPKDYLNFDEVDSKKKTEILKNTKLKSNISNEVEIITNEDGSTSEKDKGYAKVGNYEIILTYKKESKTVKVKVKDTVAPELIAPERVEIIQGTDLSAYDFKSLMLATDLAQLSDYTIDTVVDTNVPGEYSAKVSIEDASKNKIEKEFKIIVVAPVVDPNVEITSEVQTDPVTGQKKTVVTTKPKQNTTTNSSSSSSSSNSSNSSNKPSSGNTNNSSSGSSGSTNQPSSGGNSSSGGSSSSGNSSGGDIVKPVDRTIYVSYYCKEGDAVIFADWQGKESVWNSIKDIVLPEGYYDYKIEYLN